jgi:hypothetical protein
MAEIACFESIASFFNTLLSSCKAASGYALRAFARTNIKADNSFATKPDKSICSRHSSATRHEGWLSVAILLLRA